MCWWNGFRLYVCQVNDKQTRSRKQNESNDHHQHRADSQSIQSVSTVHFPNRHNHFRNGLVSFSSARVAICHPYIETFVQLNVSTQWIPNTWSRLPMANLFTFSPRHPTRPDNWPSSNDSVTMKTTKPQRRPSEALHNFKPTHQPKSTNQFKINSKSWQNPIFSKVTKCS